MTTLSYPPSKLMTLCRMARRVGVTQRWLKAQADAGHVPCLKADGRYLFNPVAVEDTLADRAATQREWSYPLKLVHEK